MANYSRMSREQAQQEYEQLRKKYEEYKSAGLKLDMSRGKPCAQQLDLSRALLSIDLSDFKDSTGTDVRNYGELSGVPEMKEIFAGMMGTDAQNIVVGGNSSLSLMHDVISLALNKGLVGSDQPWHACGKIKFLCPVPGYDRHFRITEYYGFELVPVKMLETGPDMDEVERLVKADASVKGMWCVPIFSNPGGVVYSAETVRRIAAMDCAAKDFTVMYDNAYCVHILGDKAPHLPDILAECAQAGHPDRVFEFASTSKITFAGSGVSAVAANKSSLDYFVKALGVQTIGYDKVNQLLHARFLVDYDHLIAHMKKHAAIVAPKFRIVDDILTEELGSLGIASWTKPQGGYFINFMTRPGTAKRIVKLCADASVKLTPAGAAFPYGVEEADSQIRIAPTYPSCEELEKACRLLCLCTKMAVLEQIL